MRPEYISEKDHFIERHRDLLLAGVGRELSGCWLAWDQDDDTWFADEAVILRFGSAQLEVVFSQISDLSLTVGRVNLELPPAFVAPWDGFNLKWRESCCPAIDRYIGARVRRVGVVEFRFTTTLLADRSAQNLAGQTTSVWVLAGLRWEFESGSFELYNALDENGIAGPPYDGECRVEWLNDP